MFDNIDDSLIEKRGFYQEGLVLAQILTPVSNDQTLYNKIKTCIQQDIKISQLYEYLSFYI